LEYKNNSRGESKSEEKRVEGRGVGKRNQTKQSIGFVCFIKPIQIKKGVARNSGKKYMNWC